MKFDRVLLGDDDKIYKWFGLRPDREAEARWAIWREILLSNRAT